MTENISRRNFLKTAGITAAALGITVCGGGALASIPPKVEMQSISYGEKTMDKKILITYASKAGSTAETAARMGEMLAKQNAQVDVLPVEKVGDLSAYQAVVLGSAIRMSQLLPEVVKFVEANQAILQQKSFNVFFLCMTLEKDTPENRQTVSAYLEPVRALVKPANEGMFAGVMDPKKLSLVERLLMKAMKSPVGDYRNWDQINAWAQSVAA
jgi:menaquinone-dependent protoporphyrinogen oxidase